MSMAWSAGIFLPTRVDSADRQGLVCRIKYIEVAFSSTKKLTVFQTAETSFLLGDNRLISSQMAFQCAR
jgi:hypothetical protein